MSNFLEFIINQGVSSSYSPELNRRVRLSNIACLIGSFTTAFASIFHFGTGNIQFGLILLAGSPFWSLFILINKIGYSVVVRIFQVLHGQIVVFVLAGMFGREAGLQYNFYPLLVVPFALFEMRQKWLIFTLASFLLSLWLFLEIHDYQLFPNVLGEVDVRTMHRISIMASIPLLVLLLYSFIASNTNSEEKLGEMVDELEEKEEQLIERNRQLKRARDVLFENQLKLNNARKSAERAASAKSSFLSNMSHEIRTPMNAVIGITDFLLENGKLGAMERDNLETIRYSADNLVVVINDILDFSKIDSGKLDLEKISFDLYKLIFELCKTLQFRASEKGVVIHNEIGSGVPRRVIGDPHRLNQILLNLAGNAVKFTEEGTVNIVVSEVLSDNEELVCLRFEVRDTGIGIEPDKLDAIFNNFSQASESTTRKFGGTGLGLAISKALVELMGGEIAVQSDIGKGSRFYFDVEFTNDDGYQAPDEVTEITVLDSIEGVNVLLVDDYKMNQIVAEQFLSVWGTNVTIAEDGQQALDATWEDRYDIILMDIQMPVMDGIDAAINIRANINNPNRDTPIIALTADAFDSTREKAIKAGMQDFVPKPFDKNLLFEKISVWAKKEIKISLQ